MMYGASTMNAVEKVDSAITDQMDNIVQNYELASRFGTDEPLFSNMSWWRHQKETFSALLAFVQGIHRSLVISPHKGQ